MTTITVSMSRDETLWQDNTVSPGDASQVMINLTEDNQIEIYFPIFIWSD